MMCFTGNIVLLSVLLSFGSGLIMPMKKPSGDPDMDSVINHVTLMERTMVGLQTQVTDLTTLKSNLQTAEQTIISLQNHAQTSSSELTTLKDTQQKTEEELKASKDELTAVKAELRLAETDIAILKHDLQRNPDPMEFSQLKTDFEALKASHNALVQQVNFTVIDAVSADVKSNTRNIQFLKSGLVKTESEVNKTSFDIMKTRAVVANLTTEVPLMKEELNQSIQDAVSAKTNIAVLKSQLTDVSKSINTTTTNIHSLEAQVTFVETGYDSFRYRQNITEHEVAECKTLAQSTAADLKTAQTQLQTVQTEVNTVSTDVHALRGELTIIRNKTNEDVAFQVTQSLTGSHIGWTTLKFDTVEYNTGNGYNKTTGVFSAPTSGTYIFWANVVFYNPVDYHYINIYQGSRRLTGGDCYVETSGHDCGVYPTVTTHLDVGDQVHFTTDSGGGTYIGNNGYSSYGGALLHVS